MNQIKYFKSLKEDRRYFFPIIICTFSTFLFRTKYTNRFDVYFVTEISVAYYTSTVIVKFRKQINFNKKV